MTVRFGVLSTAAINDELLPAFAAVDDAEVVGVGSRSLERAEHYASSRGIPRAYGSYDDLLVASDVDAVYISLPNGLHGEWVERALLAGKHVLCEKPLTVHSDEAKVLFELARARGRVLMEAFMYRHHPVITQVSEIVASGEIGQLQLVRSSFSFTLRHPTVDIRLNADLGGGALRDIGCYCISFAQLVIGEDPVTAFALQVMTDTGVDERTHALLLYPSGVTSLFDVSIRAPLHYGATIVGNNGIIEIPSPWHAYLDQQPLTVLWRDGRRERLESGGRNSYELEIENFCRAINGSAAPKVTAAETISVLSTIDLIEMSAIRADGQTETGTGGKSAA